MEPESYYCIHISLPTDPILSQFPSIRQFHILQILLIISSHLQLGSLHKIKSCITTRFEILVNHKIHHGDTSFIKLNIP